MSEYYSVSGVPSQSAQGASAPVRGEFSLISGGFDKLPVMAGNGNLPVFVNAGGTALAAISAALARTNLGLVIGTNVQAYSADLLAIAALTSAADRVPYATGAGTWALGTFTAFGRSVVAAVDAAAARAILTPFASGTVSVFQQTSAPVGWTKITTHNDKALRVVSGAAGSGGATAFSSVFGAGKSSGSYTLQIADMPAHGHVATSVVTETPHSHTGGWIAGGGGATSGSGTQAANTGTASTGITVATTNANTGGGGGHAHTLSLDLQYVDTILASIN